MNVVSKKGLIKQPIKNRYQRFSKISEYKFLRVLRSFADDLTAKEASEKVRVSEKTIRKLYDELRDKLLRASLMEPDSFGSAGHFLYENQEVSSRGRHMMDTVTDSDLFARTMKRHAPRVGAIDAPDSRYNMIALEVAVRVYSKVDPPRDIEKLYAPEVQRLLFNVGVTERFLKDQADNPDDPEYYASVAAKYAKVKKRIPALLAKEEFLTLGKNYKYHQFSNNLLYDDLRKFLLKEPLQSG